MKLRKNKKAIIEHAGMIILYVIVIFIFILFLSTFIDGLVSISIKTYDQENYILYNRILLSPNSFFKEKSSGLIDYGNIDIEKFNDNTLSNLFIKEKKENFAIEAILTYNNEEKTIILNKNILQLGTAIGGIPGSRYASITNNLPVKVGEHQGILKLTTVLRQDDQNLI